MEITAGQIDANALNINQPMQDHAAFRLAVHGIDNDKVADAPVATDAM